MGRLRVLSGRETCQILQEHGFREVRRRGSHIVMQRADPVTGTLTVPVPDHPELAIGLGGLIGGARPTLRTCCEPG